MTEIISVRFRVGGKEYYFDPCGTRVRQGQGVIIETATGPEYGTCTQGNTQVPEEQVVHPLRPLIRLANDRDRATLEKNREREKSALQICQEKVLEHKLDMKLVRCECSFDGNKLLFFFTSDGRVDFRALVKDLASTFHSRIELRQIGVRDETKLLGGLGICGRPFCCNGFLEQFQPVSIKMAKTQGLSLNPAKISGACGRLMCCLKYEQDAYEDAVKRMPKNESFVETPDGVGTISGVDYLRETVKVRLEEAQEGVQSYGVEEIRVVRSGKGRRPEDYVPPAREELEKLRRKPTEPEEQSTSFGWELPAEEPTKRPERRKDRRERPSRPEGQNGGKKQDSKAPQEPQPSKGGQRSGGRRQKGGKPGAGKPQQQPRPAREEQPAQQQAQPPAPAKEGQQKSRNHRRRYRGGKGKQEK